MAEGSFYKRCGCRDAQTNRLLGARCPSLRRRGGTFSAEHGTWHYQYDLPAGPGEKRQLLRRGAFATKDEAISDLDHAKDLLALSKDPDVVAEITEILRACRSGTPLPETDTLRGRLAGGTALTGSPTLATYLPEWLAGHPVDEGTAVCYESHIRLYLIPHLGKLRLDQLKVRHIKAMFTALEDRNTQIRAARASTDPAVRATVRGVRTLSAATFHRIRATLRVALNDAISDEYISVNPAKAVRLGDGTRPKAREWTDERVAAWETTGFIPSAVMIWTPVQTGAFLDYAADDPLYPLLHLMAFRGLRRGEACGLRRADLRLQRAEICVSNQIAQVKWKPVQKKTKTRAGDRTIALDQATVGLLRAHLKRQQAHARFAGFTWHDSGMVFSQADGQPLHPATVTKRFKQLYDEVGLPPIRLHDLRHGAASIAYAAGADLKAISQLLGHSTIAITADTYTEVFREVDHAQAAATTAIVPLKPRREAS